jgi:hypothetical protein
MRNINPNKKTASKPVGVRMPEDMRNKLIQISAMKSLESGEIVTFTDTVIEVIEKGLNGFEPSKSVA